MKILSLAGLGYISTLNGSETLFILSIPVAFLLINAV